MLVENIYVEADVEINDVVLEKGSYQSKDFCFFGGGINDCFTNKYKIDKDGNVNLVIYDEKLKYFSEKEKERLFLKPNGIIHIYNSDLDYKLVLEEGVIKKLYRADSSEDFEKFPKEIQMNYNAEWK